MDKRGLSPAKVALSDLSPVIGEGWRMFRAMPLPSLAYASVAAVIGLVLLYAVGRLGISPMSLPFAGGFMLVAPAMLGGFFRLAQCLQSGQGVSIATPFAAFLRTPMQTWMVSLFCAFIFLIWITDAGVLYSFIIGGTDLPYELPWLIQVNESIAGFWFWGALMGSVLAFIIFTISAFSVPLLFEGRGGLVQAVHASVRGVFANFVVTMSWALILTLSILLAIMLLPLLLVVLPVMAYASFALYRIVFPPAK